MADGILPAPGPAASVLLDESASRLRIAIAHSAFNILCTTLMLSLSGFLVRLVTVLVPDDQQSDVFSKLDERLLATPSIAIDIQAAGGKASPRPLTRLSAVELDAPPLNRCPVCQTASGAKG